MFDNHIWGVTADNESISANLFISGFFKSLMLVSASAPKTAYQLCKLLQLGFLIVLCSRTLNLLKPRKQSLHHSCRFRHLMWCWSNVLLLFCHRRFVSSHVNSLARLQNYPKTRIGIVTEMLAHVSSSFFWTEQTVNISSTPFELMRVSLMVRLPQLNLTWAFRLC